MYWLDTAIVAILLIGAAFGALSGFLWQVARIVSLGAALYCSLFFNDVASEIVQRDFLQGADVNLAKGIAYVVVFAVVYLTLYIVALFLDQTMRAVRLETIDRVFGALLGASKMCVVAAAICFGMTNYPHERTKEWMERSTLAPVLSESVQYVLMAIPEELKDEFTSNVQTWWQTTREKAIQK